MDSRAIGAVMAAWALACAGPRRVTTVAEAPTARVVAPSAAAVEALRAGQAALAAFEVEEALAALERAKGAGPLAYADHVALWEQLGIAYGYLDREADARAAFAELLALDPGHALAYTLSPKATTQFEAARADAKARAQAEVELRWPYSLTTSDRIPIDVEVVADPGGRLATATVHVAGGGAGAAARAIPITLPKAGGRARLTLPPVGGTTPTKVDVWLVASDRQGNETLTWASAARPRPIALAVREELPWTRKWWVWAIVGGVVAAGTGGVVYALEQEPPDTVGGSFVGR